MKNDDIERLANSINEDLPRMRGHQNSNTGIIIPRVPERLRFGENDPYEPRIISFGPYHHGKPRLQAMEKYKWRYLDKILERNRQIHLKDYIKMIEEEETTIRSWYPDYFDINSSEEFVKMMLLDGCFVVEYLLRMLEWFDKDEELSSMIWMHGEVQYDILLLENQIPFFILNKIFELLSVTPSPPMEAHSSPSWFTGLATLAISHLNCMTGQRADLPSQVHHLLHLYHSFHLYTPEVEGDRIITIDGVTPEISAQVPYRDIPSATVLQEAGIKFKRKEGSSLDVTFSNGKMKIPPLLIDADTKSRLRNLVIFEQFYPNFGNAKSFSAFVDFIKCLATTPKDVALLYQKGIIVTSYDHKYVAGLLSQLDRGISLRKDHYLAPMYGEVSKYWQNRNHTWRAFYLRSVNNYFSSPWRKFGTVTGGIVLVLTLIQTIFSVYSAFRH